MAEILRFEEREMFYYLGSKRSAGFVLGFFKGKKVLFPHIDCVSSVKSAESNSVFHTELPKPAEEWRIQKQHECSLHHLYSQCQTPIV